MRAMLMPRQRIIALFGLTSLVATMVTVTRLSGGLNEAPRPVRQVSVSESFISDNSQLRDVVNSVVHGIVVNATIRTHIGQTAKTTTSPSPSTNTTTSTKTTTPAIRSALARRSSPTNLVAQARTGSSKSKPISKVGPHCTLTCFSLILAIYSPHLLSSLLRSFTHFRNR